MCQWHTCDKYQSVKIITQQVKGNLAAIVSVLTAKTLHNLEVRKKRIFDFFSVRSIFISPNEHQK